MCRAPHSQPSMPANHMHKRILTTTQRENLEVARQAIATIAKGTPANVHGEELAWLLIEHLCGEPTPLVTVIAALALARLVEHERGEREVVA